MNNTPPIPGDPKIIQFTDNPTDRNECSLVYNINHILRPGEAVILGIPDPYQSSILDLITLTHRKADPLVHRTWDPEPSYSRILVFDKKTNEWLYWGNKHYNTVSFGDKMAEARDPENPEVEALHDWVAYSGIITPQVVCVINSGKGIKAASYIHSLTIDFFPKDVSQKQSFIFSPGTVFVDLKKNIKELFGGGEIYKGQYPQAVAVNLSSPATFPVSEKGDHYYLKGKQLHIVVDHHYVFSRIEVAVGDTKDTGKFNKDGHIGTLGGAKLDIALCQKNNKQYLARDLNVPPQGVLKASPKTKLDVSEGDEFIISSKKDPSYVMGVRIQ